MSNRGEICAEDVIFVRYCLNLSLGFGAARTLKPFTAGEHFSIRHLWQKKKPPGCPSGLRIPL